MTKTAFIGKLVPKYEDGGQAIICEVVEPISNEAPHEMFVRVHSYDDRRGGSVLKETAYLHTTIRKFLNKMVLITIEVIE